MEQIKQFYERVNNGILVVEKILICLMLFSMIFLSFGQVVARNVFQTGFIWIDSVLKIEVLWLTFMGASMATHYRQHIKIDFLVNIIHDEKYKKNIDIVSQVFATLLCFFLFISAASFIQLVSANTISTFFRGVPDWYFQLVIPYCFLVMTIRCPNNIWRIIYGEESSDL